MFNQFFHSVELISSNVEFGLTKNLNLALQRIEKTKENLRKKHHGSRLILRPSADRLARVCDFPYQQPARRVICRSGQCLSVLCVVCSCCLRFGLCVAEMMTMPTRHRAYPTSTRCIGSPAGAALSFARWSIVSSS